MRRASGYATITNPEGPVAEVDTFTCAHCGHVVFVRGGNASACGGFCRLCMKHTCSTCADGSCTPFERKLLEIEARDRLRRAASS